MPKQTRAVPHMTCDASWPCLGDMLFSGEPRPVGLTALPIMQRRSHMKTPDASRADPVSKLDT